jgi:hypothetical protein
LLLLLAATGCDPEKVSEDRVMITVFHKDGFGFPQTFNPITSLRVTVVDRSSGQRLNQSVFRIDAPSDEVTVDQIPFGSNRQVYVEGLGAIGQTLASGVTPSFDEGQTDEPGMRNFLVYLTEVGSISPLSAIFAGPEVRPSPFVLGPRSGHTASTLPDGRVMIVGGAKLTGYNLGLKCAYGPCPPAIGNIESIYDTLEVYEPTNGYFDSAKRNGMGFKLSTPRVHHCTVKMLDGSLLVIGGLTLNVNKQLVGAKSADLISVEGDGFRISTIELPEARIRHACAVTGNGTVIVTGGMRYDDQGEIIALDSVDVLAPNTQAFVSAPSFEGARWDHTAVAVGELVMLSGGTNGQEVLSDAQVLVGGAFLSLGEMQQARFGHSSILLSKDGGRYVLAIGGFTSPDESEATSTYEVFDVVEQRWVEQLSGSSMRRARAYFDLVELESGDLLALGGIGLPPEGGRLGSIRSVELLTRDTSSTATFSAQELSSQLSAGRFDTASVVLSGGLVLITGGGRYEEGGFASYQLSDVYNPGPPLSVLAP